MNVLKCDICGKIFEYNASFINSNVIINGDPVTKRVFNKVKLYHVPRPPKDQYDDSDLTTLYSYDVCPSCARRLAELICREKANHENQAWKGIR